jgi:hypothetical protein
MALPRGTTGSLWPSFDSARRVSLAVRLAYAIALNGRFPTALSQPSRASVTIWEATAPVKLPTTQGSGPGSRAAVRHQNREGRYLKDGSTGTGVPASKPTAYPAHPNPGASAKLE